MSAGEEIQVISAPPVVALNRIGRIETFEVMASELDALDAAMSRENQALGFATASGGVGIPMLASLALAAAPTAAAIAVYLSIGGVAVISMLWFGVTYMRARKERPRLLKRIRER